MPICMKCGQQAKKAYDCEHTIDQEHCIECYTELHYYLTEPNVPSLISKNGNQCVT